VGGKGSLTLYGKKYLCKISSSLAPLPSPYHLQATMRKPKKFYIDKWETLAQKHFHPTPKQINNTNTK
jgi:hypothetical protein